MSKQEIYNVDFREKMGGLNKDKTIIITDPPYNIGYHYNSYDDKLSDDDYHEMLNYFEN